MVIVIIGAASSSAAGGAGGVAVVMIMIVVVVIEVSMIVIIVVVMAVAMAVVQVFGNKRPSFVVSSRNRMLLFSSMARQEATWQMLLPQETTSTSFSEVRVSHSFLLAQSLQD